MGCFINVMLVIVVRMEAKIFCAKKVSHIYKGNNPRNKHRERVERKKSLKIRKGKVHCCHVRRKVGEKKEEESSKVMVHVCDFLGVKKKKKKYKTSLMDA